MTISGHVENGQIVLDEAVPLTEGMKVRVELLGAKQPKDAETGPTLNEQFSSIIGVIDDLPSDFARNHDHYLHGQPKK